MRNILIGAVLLVLLAAFFYGYVYAQPVEDSVKTLFIRMDRLEKRIRDMQEKIDDIDDVCQTITQKIDQLARGQQEIVKELGTLKMRIR